MFLFDQCFQIARRGQRLTSPGLIVRPPPYAFEMLSGRGNIPQVETYDRSKHTGRAWLRSNDLHHIPM